MISHVVQVVGLVKTETHVVTASRVEILVGAIGLVFTIAVIALVVWFIARQVRRARA